MLNEYLHPAHVFIACGYTDLRLGIDGLAALVQEKFHLDPFGEALFFFCGRRTDRIKGLFWDGDGFLLLGTVFCFYTNDLREVAFNGLETRMRPAQSQSSSFGG